MKAWIEYGSSIFPALMIQIFNLLTAILIIL